MPGNKEVWTVSHVSQLPQNPHHVISILMLYFQNGDNDITAFSSSDTQTLKYSSSLLVT